MKTLLGVALIALGGLIGLSRIINWLHWSPQQWDMYTRGRTPEGVLRWLAYEAVFGAFWGGMLYFGFRLV
jgi:hypothetical protein